MSPSALAPESVNLLLAFFRVFLTSDAEIIRAIHPFLRPVLDERRKLAEDEAPALELRFAVPVLKLFELCLTTHSEIFLNVLPILGAVIDAYKPDPLDD